MSKQKQAKIRAARAKKGAAVKIPAGAAKQLKVDLTMLDSTPKEPEQSSGLALDFGEFYFNKFGIQPIFLMIVDPHITVSPQEVNVGFNVRDEYLGNILLTHEQFEALDRSDGAIGVEVVPDPDSRYTAKIGEEIDHILPFRLFVSEENSPDSTPAADAQQDEQIA